MYKEKKTDINIIDIIRKRWSPRAFNPNKLVEIEKLNRILEAARWAPSCFNEQPWRFIIGRKNKEYEYEKILNCLEDGNKIWVKNAPLIIILCTKKTFELNGLINNYADYDAGQAAAYIVLQATAEGLFAHQMAGILKDKIIDEFNIPDNFRPVTAIAIGYYGDINILPENLKEREIKQQERLPLSQLVYIEDWLNKKNIIFDE